VTFGREPIDEAMDQGAAAIQRAFAAPAPTDI
jgi:hypothetical protein